jgi:hypothetical protein
MSVALGQDMSASAIQLGKALNDPIKGVTALQKVGVSFTQSQKDQIATLVESGRHDGRPEAHPGGADQGVRRGGCGCVDPVRQAAGALGNLAEQVGSYLIPVVDDLSSFMTDDLGPGLANAASVVGSVLGPALSGLGNTVKFLVEGFGDLSGPLQAGIIAFGAWAIAGDKIMGALRPMGGALSGLKGTFSAFGEALDYARQNGDGLGTVLKSVSSYAGGQALDAFKKLGRAIGPELAVAVGTFVIGEVVDGIRSLTQASDDAKAAAEGLAQALTLTDTAADRRAIRKAIEDTDGLIEVLQKAGISSETAINGLLGQKDAQDQVNAALQTYIGTVNTRGDDGAESVRQARLAYNELATGYGNAASNARFFGDAATSAGQSAQGAAATTAASQQTLEDAQAAQDALQAWIDKLAGYQGLLQTAAQATADATKDSKDSWQDYADSAKVSLDEFAQHLQDQITAQENWHQNLVIVAQRAGYDVAAAARADGRAGRRAGRADGEQHRRRDAAHGRPAAPGRHERRHGRAQALDTQMKVMAAIGAARARATASGHRRRSSASVPTSSQDRQQYGSTSPAASTRSSPPSASRW